MSTIIDVEYNLETTKWHWDGKEYTNIQLVLAAATHKHGNGVDVNVHWTGKPNPNENKATKHRRTLDIREINLARDRGLTTAEYIRKHYPKKQQQPYVRQPKRIMPADVSEVGIRSLQEKLGIE